MPFHQQLDHYLPVGALTETECSPLRDSNTDGEITNTFLPVWMVVVCIKPAACTASSYTCVAVLSFLATHSADSSEEQVYLSPVKPTSSPASENKKQMVESRNLKQFTGSPLDGKKRQFREQ